MVSKKFIEEGKKLRAEKLKELKHETKRLKRLSKKPKGTNGTNNYKWCNAANVVPKTKSLRTEDGKELSRFIGKIKVL